jgi:hydroxymethylpyrimidine pyrophosphatase-like HAD family hydrolase
MIMFAGFGIAMGNAPDAIKAIADHVTDTNMNDGVRKAIEMCFQV